MGGFGSGRFSGWGTKLTIEDYCSLDVRYLHKAGYLTSGSVASLAWRDGARERVGSIVIARAEARVRLLYRSRREGEGWKDVEEAVPLVWTPCHYGGTRPWFLCPSRVNGRSCWRRVAILYNAGAYFLCRQCYRLSYESQNEGLLDRRIRKVHKIRERLGVSADLQEPILWKPPRMHWKTFSRLALQARALEGSTFGLMAAKLNRRHAIATRLIAKADTILARHKKP